LDPEGDIQAGFAASPEPTFIHLDLLQLNLASLAAFSI